MIDGSYGSDKALNRFKRLENAFDIDLKYCSINEIREAREACNLYQSKQYTIEVNKLLNTLDKLINAIEKTGIKVEYSYHGEQKSWCNEIYCSISSDLEYTIEQFKTLKRPRNNVLRTKFDELKSEFDKFDVHNSSIYNIEHLYYICNDLHTAGYVNNKYLLELLKKIVDRVNKVNIR